MWLLAPRTEVYAAQMGSSFSSVNTDCLALWGLLILISLDTEFLHNASLSDMGMQEEQARQLSTPDLAGSELGSPVTVALGREPGHCGHRACLLITAVLFPQGC